MRTFTVYVYENGSKCPTCEYGGIRAESGEGAINRVVDMFRKNKADCRFAEEKVK